MAVPKKMWFPPSAGGSIFEIITLLDFIPISTGFLCFLFIKMFHVTFTLRFIFTET